jgi:cytochrome c553
MFHLLYKWALPVLLTLCWSLGAVAATDAPSAIAERVRACTSCHGEQGRAAPDGYYPRLAGKPAGYLYHQLLNFAEGRRRYGPMAQLVQPLSDDYLLRMARYFASLDVPYPAPSREAPRISTQALEHGRQLALHGDAARKLPACATCHGTPLMGTQPNVPALLGLPLDYLTAQLGAWQTGERQAHAPDCMAEIVRRMNPGDIIAVASWLSMQPVPTASHARTLQQGVALDASLRCGSAPELDAQPQQKGQP